MTSDLLVELLQALDAPQGRYAELERYATGAQPLAFVSPESRKALDAALYKLAVNIPALAVSALVERLRPVGFSDPRAWELFTATDLDQLAAQAMSDALTYDTGYVLVWSKDGRPVASVESPKQCAVLRDPADRSVLAGVKRFRTKTETHCYIYLPGSVEHHMARTPGAATAGFELVEELDNPLGQVPLVPISNGRSEIDDLKCLVDALNKVILSMLVGVHRAGFGRSWATGLELASRPILDAAGNPILDGDGEPMTELVNPISDLSTMPMALAEDAGTKFGNFNEPTLSGFETAVRVLLSQIMAVSALPSHMIGIMTSQPTSADALRASEASLTARAESKQLAFGRAWEQVGRLLIAVDTGEDPTMPLRIKWADASTRSTAQEMDAAAKAQSTGLLSRRTILGKYLGLSDDEIAAELDGVNRDAEDARDIAVAKLMTGRSDR